MTLLAVFAAAAGFAFAYRTANIWALVLVSPIVAVAAVAAAGLGYLVGLFLDPWSVAWVVYSAASAGLVLGIVASVLVGAPRGEEAPEAVSVRLPL